MLIDDVNVHIIAGKGGDGVVAFNKNMMELGPTGGSGGKGGSVYLEGVSDIGALKKFRFKKEFKADDGKDGASQFRDGADGKDLILKAPVGTVAHNLDRQEAVEVKKIGERVFLAEGGKGGRGNFHFRSSTNTTPKDFETGLLGEEYNFRFELKLIADIGFIGLPNVGKSSLLNELTNAGCKVANYPFTTLEPNLGVYFDLIIADIPGLIEGASAGKGLGVKFLRHVERTRVLFHFVAADSDNPEKDYEVVREELKKHSEALCNKPEYIIISRSDNVSKESLLKIEERLEKKGKDILPLSILSEEEMSSVRKLLNKIIKTKRA